MNDVPFYIFHNWGSSRWLAPVDVIGVQSQLAADFSQFLYQPTLLRRELFFVLVVVSESPSHFSLFEVLWDSVLGTASRAA
jgi:hypothetical protein